MQQLDTPKARVSGSGKVLKPDGSVRTDAPPPPKPEESKR
jgi:hypothetical protein